MLMLKFFSWPAHPATTEGKQHCLQTKASTQEGSVNNVTCLEIRQTPGPKSATPSSVVSS